MLLNFNGVVLSLLFSLSLSLSAVFGLQSVVVAFSAKIICFRSGYLKQFTKLTFQTLILEVFIIFLLY